MTSNAAKAAAILVFTSGVDGFDHAVEIFDALEKDDASVSDTLDRFPGVCRCYTGTLNDADWYDEIVNLALNIDAARKHFDDQIATDESRSNGPRA